MSAEISYCHTSDSTRLQFQPYQKKKYMFFKKQSATPAIRRGCNSSPAKKQKKYTYVFKYTCFF